MDYLSLSCPSPTALPYQSEEEDNGLHLLGMAATKLLSTDHLEEVEVEGVVERTQYDEMLLIYVLQNYERYSNGTLLERM